MICPECGQTVDNSDQFCDFCGRKLDASYEEPNPFAIGTQPSTSYAENYSSSAPDIPGFGGAIKTCFTKYARFSGRASRSEFWYWQLMRLSVYLVIFLLLEVEEDEESVPTLVLVCIFWFWILATFLPNLAVWVRRLHDTGRSGRWMLLPVFPFASGIGLALFVDAVGFFFVALGLLVLAGTILLFIVLFVFAALPSFPGSNKYGLQPARRRQ